MKRKNSTRAICTAAIIAALYTVLTYFCAMLGLSGGAVQLRLSEALCVLPAFTPYAIPGLFAGCLISNILTSATVFDIIFGSMATLLGALGTYFIGTKHAVLAVIPPILANTAIIPPVLAFSVGADESIWFLIFSICISECVSAGVLGALLYRMAERIKHIF